jgi:hypothetical protein
MKIEYEVRENSINPNHILSALFCVSAGFDDVGYAISKIYNIPEKNISLENNYVTPQNAISTYDLINYIKQHIPPES